jgi:hypothetical protein
MLLVAGSDPIYAQRSESFSYVGRNCGGLYLGPDERRRLIAELLSESPDEISWSIYPNLTIEYQSPEQTVTALLAFIEAQQQMYRTTADELAARDLIEASDITHSIPTLHLNLQDMRGEGVERLQDTLQNIVSLPARVEWSFSCF